MYPKIKITIGTDILDLFGTREDAAAFVGAVEPGLLKEYPEYSIDVEIDHRICNPPLVRFFGDSEDVDDLRTCEAIAERIDEILSETLDLPI